MRRGEWEVEGVRGVVPVPPPVVRLLCHRVPRTGYRPFHPHLRRLRHEGSAREYHHTNDPVADRCGKGNYWTVWRTRQGLDVSAIMCGENRFQTAGTSRAHGRTSPP